MFSVWWYETLFVYDVFKRIVGVIIRALDCEGSHADIAVYRCVAVNRQIVIVLMDAMPFLSPCSVAKIEEIVGEVCAALLCEQYRFCVLRDVDVVYVAIGKEVVSLYEIVNSVKPGSRVVETLYVSGQRKRFEPSRARLENRAVGRGIHYILAEIKPFVYAGYDKVVGFVKPQRCKTHAIGGRAVHAERAHAVQIIHFFTSKGL